MDSVSKVLEPVTIVINKNIVPALTNPIVSLIIGWIIILNVLDSSLYLPTNLQSLIYNPITKVLAIFIAFYYSTGSMQTALLSTIISVIIYKLLLMVPENFDLINITPTIIPGCTNVTVKDLLKLYGGNMDILKQKMYNSGVPLDLPLNDLNAPLISTYLINHNSGSITATCSAPI